MWGNNEGGGFDNTTSMFNSPSTAPSGKGQGQNKSRLMAPVTIKQVAESPEDGLKIKNMEIQIVKVVGIIKSIDVSSIKVTYTIEDSTGSITGISYLEESESESSVPVVENTYCTVVGSVRTQGESKHIMIFNIYPVTDFNEILEHYLAVVHMALKAETLKDESQIKVMKEEMISSYGGSDSSAIHMQRFNMDPKCKKIYEILTSSTNEGGMDIDEINAAMPIKLPADQIRHALDYLVCEGHIFTTIDDFHYKSTECPY